VTPVGALKLALKKEETSINLYKKLLKEHRSLEWLLGSLLNEEFKHKKLIEGEILKLTRY
jgi:hypothetical protein